MNRVIRAVLVRTALSVLAAFGVGCEALVQLDRSAVDAGPTICSICSDAADGLETGADGARSIEIRTDATTADSGTDASHADSGADPSAADSGSDTGGE
jgi:hypothetical protein